MDEAVYDGLHRKIGRRNISRFLESLARPHVLRHDIDEAYRVMAEDEAREREALEWSEGVIADSAHDAR